MVLYNKSTIKSKKGVAIYVALFSLGVNLTVVFHLTKAILFGILLFIFGIIGTIISFYLSSYLK
jgi:hypothetical protein